MSSDNSNKRDRTIAREEARKIASKAASSPAKNKSLWVKLSVIIGALVIVAIVALLVVNGSKSTSIDLEASKIPPANVSETGGTIQVSAQLKKDAPKVDVYVDFLCPACKAFEEENGDALNKLAADGDITLETHTVAILDHLSSTNYSSRAGNAQTCVVNSFPEKVVAYSKKLFEDQPAEGGAGITNAALTKAAESVGATGLGECISGGNYRGWLADATVNAKISATPTVRINGEEWDRTGTILDAIQTASK